jgi:hypothetical protein
MGGTLSVSALAGLYPMSTTAVQKHVAVLGEAGLVHRTRRGREQLDDRVGHDGQEVADLAEAGPGQYSFLISKKEPRIVPASLDFCLANLNREASSAGTSIPSESLNPTARFLGASTVYITLIDRPLS